MRRWHLSDLVILTLVSGIAFASYRYFWQPGPATNSMFYLAIFLACVAMSSLGSFCARPRWRRVFQGFTSFGWLELVFGMWGSLAARDYVEHQRIVQCSQSDTKTGLGEASDPAG
jgi:hypothetical protein